MNREKCLELDQSDPLTHYRGEFLLRENTIYMDGNSLGPLPKRVLRRMETTLREEWGLDLIQSWNKNNWIDLPLKVGEKVAKLVGAKKGQVICCDSISVNLFKVLAAAIYMNPKRSVIISQDDNFPTDLYMAQGLSSLVGENKCRLKLVELSELNNSLDESVAVLMLTEVNFRSGERHDMKALTELAQQKGILVIWDLAHSAGAFPVELDACNVDFAVGCGYKYLNGGPGAPAFLYVAKRHQSQLKQPLCGWMGHRSPFAFNTEYYAAEGIQKLLSGTPPILSMVALDSALDVFASLNLDHARKKSIALSEIFIKLMASDNHLNKLKLISPMDPHHRGSQLAYCHDHAFAISQALIEENIIVDFRAPNIIRFGFTPLYLRFIDIYVAVEKLATIMKKEIYLKEKHQRKQKVT